MTLSPRRRPSRVFRSVPVTVPRFRIAERGRRREVSVAPRGQGDGSIYEWEFEPAPPDWRHLAGWAAAPPDEVGEDALS